MSDLAPFTNLPVCVKCGGGMFTTHWFGPSHEMDLPEQLQMLTAGARSQEEHLAQTCDRCGWTFAMQTKDHQDAK